MFIETFSAFTLSPYQEIQPKYNQTKYKNVTNKIKCK